MPNYRNLALKLQSALCMAGEHVTMEEKRFYSIRYNRMLTKYIVKRQLPGRPKEILVESYSVIEVVKTMAEIYAAVKEAADGS